LKIDSRNLENNLEKIFEEFLEESKIIFNDFCITNLWFARDNLEKIFEERLAKEKERKNNLRKELEDLKRRKSEKN
jgi:hypothetical protein